MSDLISRKAVIKAIQNYFIGKIENHVNEVDVVDCNAEICHEVIDNIPTAYNVDDVVEKIREQDGVCTGCKRQYECNECSIGERIEIIKRGGKDEIN